ncbi:MAG: hypothetical protein INQ03_05860 [Candidatus Heimdallarchaeota archaeon]|nr:hypothetical protein [Candidatus Heimdallarchaeota archaeon]
MEEIITIPMMKREAINNITEVRDTGSIFATDRQTRNIQQVNKNNAKIGRKATPVPIFLAATITRYKITMTSIVIKKVFIPIKEAIISIHH